MNNEFIDKEEIQEEKIECIKRCPLGGQCFNPMCMFGCIEY